MYILVEGMPGTGKSTLAQAFARHLPARYMKSVFSDAPPGRVLRPLVTEIPAKELEPYYLSDLLLDELRLARLLNTGDVVRDKCYASSYSHLQAHGALADGRLAPALLQSYAELAQLAHIPDHVIFLLPDLEKILAFAQHKNDCSYWDKYLFANEELFSRQAEALQGEITRAYGSRVTFMKPFEADPDSVALGLINKWKDNNDHKT